MAPTLCIGGKKGDIMFVQCEGCNRFELFENSGLVDRKQLDSDYSCRFCDIDKHLKSIEDRLKAVEGKVSSIEVKVNSFDAKSEEFSDSLSSKVDIDSVASVSSRLQTGELVLQDTVNRLDKVESRVFSLDTVISPQLYSDATRVKANIEGKSTASVHGKVKFCEKFRNRGNKTVVLVGDSMCRGVGRKLSENSHMFSAQSYGGARIETLAEKVKAQVVEKSDDTHVVVMVGTNNLTSDGTSVIQKKYRDLLLSLKDSRCRKCSVIGIMRRANDGMYCNSKRLAVNEDLRSLCEEFGVEYVDPTDIYRSVAVSKFRKSGSAELSILDRWGLHLNEWGQDEVAAFIFKHCVGFLC